MYLFSCDPQYQTVHLCPPRVATSISYFSTKLAFPFSCLAFLLFCFVIYELLPQLKPSHTCQKILLFSQLCATNSCILMSCFVSDKYLLVSIIDRTKLDCPSISLSTCCHPLLVLVLRALPISKRLMTFHCVTARTGVRPM